MQFYDHSAESPAMARGAGNMALSKRLANELSGHELEQQVKTTEEPKGANAAPGWPLEMAGNTMWPRGPRGPGRLRSPCHGRNRSPAALISFLHFVTIPEQEIIFNFVIITTSRFHSQLLSVCCCTRTKRGINTNCPHEGKVQEARNCGSPGETMPQVNKSITNKISLPTPTSPPQISFIKSTCLGGKWKNLPLATQCTALGCAHLKQADRWPCKNWFNSSFRGYTATRDSTWVCGEQELCYGKFQHLTS